MKPGRIRTIILITVVIVWLGCLLPWPGRVNVTLPGVEANFDGTVKKDVTVTIDGWYLKYLFRQDRMRVSVGIQETNSDTNISMELDGPVYDSPVTEKIFASPFYNAGTNAYHTATLGFNDSMDVFTLRCFDCESLYIAASNVSETLPEILERYSLILD